MYVHTMQVCTVCTYIPCRYVCMYVRTYHAGMYVRIACVYLCCMIYGSRLN